MKYMVRPLIVMAGLALFAAGCEMFRSDAQNASIHAEKQKKKAIASMKASTAETERGEALAGDALVAALNDTTHVFEYGSAPGGARGRHIEREYFAPGGSFVFATSQGIRQEGSWRVDGPRLCIVNPWFGTSERCFTIAKTTTGRIQYFIDDPASDYHTLLTKVTDDIRPGPVTE